MARLDALPFEAIPMDKAEAGRDGSIEFEVLQLPPPDAEQPDQPQRPELPTRDAPVDATRLPEDSDLGLDGKPRDDAASDTDTLVDGRRDTAIATGGVPGTGGRIATGETLATGGTRGTGGTLPCDRPYVFCEDFSDGMARWTVNEGTWYVTDSQTLTQESATTGSVKVTEGHWTAMTVEASIRTLAFGGTTSAYRAEIYARYQDSQNFFALSIRGDGKIGIRRKAGNIGDTVEIETPGDTWHKLKLKVYESGGKTWLEAYWDGLLRTTASDADSLSGGFLGSAGVGVYGNVQAEFDNVQISVP